MFIHSIKAQFELNFAQSIVVVELSMFNVKEEKPSLSPITSNMVLKN
jgi:hypothetical protein